MLARSSTLALAALLAWSAPAAASDLSEAIQAALDDFGEEIEDARIWKLRIKPTFGETVVWTDNVFLNARNEQPFVLTRVVGTNSTITNPAQLRRIQRSTADFRELESEGQVSDVVSRTNLNIGLVLPVNPDRSKLLDMNEINVLSVQLRRHEYFDRNELDNGDFALSTDVFGLLSDVLDFTAGNRIWVRFGAKHSRLEEPLDTDIVDLQQVGIESVDFKNFERTDSEARVAIGFDENLLDAQVGAAWFRRRLSAEELRQSEHDRLLMHAEAGYDLPWFQQKRVYVRGELEQVRPNDRVAGGIQALNDGDRVRGVVGLQGALLSEKLDGRLEVGYRSWTSDVDTGASADSSSSRGVVGRAQLAYQPFSGRSTRVQLSYTRTTEVSAISNFNDVHRGSISVRNPVIPDVIDGSLSFGFTRTEPSAGPHTRLYDVSVGLDHRPFDQVDVSLRYVYRYNDSRDELRVESSFVRGSRQFVFISQSDGDFVQNLLELSVNVRF